MAVAPSTGRGTLLRRIANATTLLLTIGFVCLLLWGLWIAKAEGKEIGLILLCLVGGSLGIAGFAYAHLRSPWLYGLWLCFLIAAVVTPPDPQSMLLVAAPLVALYLLILWRWKRWKSSGP